MVDETDLKIILAVQEDADRRMADLEKKLLIPRSTIHNRIQRLKKTGVISHIRAVVNPKKIALPVTVIVHIVVSFKNGVHAVAQQLMI